MKHWAARVNIDADAHGEDLHVRVRDDLDQLGANARVVTGTSLSIEVFEPLHIAIVQKYLTGKGWDAEWVEHENP